MSNGGGERLKDRSFPKATKQGVVINEQSTRATRSKTQTQSRGTQKVSRAKDSTAGAATKRDRSKKPKENKKDERDGLSEQKTNTSGANYAVVVRPKKTQSSADKIKELNNKCK